MKAEGILGRKSRANKDTNKDTAQPTELGNAGPWNDKGQWQETEKVGCPGNEGKRVDSGKTKTENKITQT